MINEKTLGLWRIELDEELKDSYLIITMSQYKKYRKNMWKDMIRNI